MGRAAGRVKKAIEAAGEPPRGVRVELLGQLPPMLKMFQALGVGLFIAVFVIVVLLTAYFQSPRMALISVGAVPGVLAGIAVILFVTNTSLNIESFMGSIMCMGVSVSNSVMLVTFMNEHWKAGTPALEAAVLGAGERLRPILMTACAMTMGMIPMALALEKGSEMQAPLGLAVIGGLVMSTFATLLVLPSVFAVVLGSRVATSPSMYPGDKDSRYYDPHAHDESYDHHESHSHGHHESHSIDSAPSAVSHDATTHAETSGGDASPHVTPPESEPPKSAADGPGAHE
jgi:Cu/Ag efflux pump CusA